MRQQGERVAGWWLFMLSLFAVVLAVDDGGGIRSFIDLCFAPLFMALSALAFRVAK